MSFCIYGQYLMYVCVVEKMKELNLISIKLISSIFLLMRNGSWTGVPETGCTQLMSIILVSLDVFFVWA